MKKIISIILTVTAVLSAVIAGPVSAEEPPMTAAETRELIERVNDRWISDHRSAPGYSWDNAAYYVGNTEAYFTTGIEAYREYSETWSEHNGWKGHPSNSNQSWDNGNVYHADNQTCFQIYADLFALDGDYGKISRALEVVGTQITTDKTDYWWWCDALFMAMPVMTRLYRITGDKRYADKLYEYFNDCRGKLYDSEERLFFRDSGYINSRIDGQKNFWARGNGWVLAGLAMVLRDMPEDWEHYGYFRQVYLDMCEAVVDCQKVDAAGNGYWTQSMLPMYPTSSENSYGYETSGTAFLTYGLLWGVNNGLLTEEKYLDAAMRGVNYLKNVAIDETGYVGYSQEIGSAATKATAPEVTQNFAVGATLLALCELYKYQGGLSGDIYPYLQRKLSTGVALSGSGFALVNGRETVGGVAVMDNKYIPLRFLAESLGYSVDWSESGTAVSNSCRSVLLKADSGSAVIDGVTAEISPPIIAGDGRMYIDIGSAANVLGRHVAVYDGAVIVDYTPMFKDCESGALDMLISILSTGKLPDRPLQEERDFSSRIPELRDERRIKIVSASADKIPEPQNPPENAFDDDIGSRYAAIGPTAVFDLGETKYVEEIALSFWQYESRTTAFDLEVSVDGEVYEPVFSGSSQRGERFIHLRVERDVRYIRFVGRGNSNSEWTSLLEIVPLSKS
ncbi:MAG: glycoside hydrolase family 88 protein [Oscillospiraceae bacterium]|nr:glycoside hydrolase family 88 protein [Oscillospiraceae bacterium]